MPKKIKFVFGDSITFTEAAQLIRKEGKLVPFSFITESGERCALGVIEDFSRDSYGAIPNRVMKDRDLRDEIIKYNDHFTKSLPPTLRAFYVAKWLEEKDNQGVINWLMKKLKR